MNATWLYGLIEALDEIACAAQKIDDVPNIQEWVEGIRREERERCAKIADAHLEKWERELGHVSKGHRYAARQIARALRSPETTT